MPTPLGLLLRARLLRREREGKNRRARRQAGLRPPHSKKVEVPVEEALSTVPSLKRLPPSFVSSTLGAEATLEAPACARWTHYGMWTDDGKKVLNERGDVIYEVSTWR